MNLEKLISKKVKKVTPSGIRKYFDLLNEMKDAISLGVGEPDFITPLNIREAGIKAINDGHTHYSSNAGYIELREEIAKYMQRKIAVKYNPKDEIIVTVGASEGIDIALRALINEGDEIIIPEPSFVAYQGCATLAGAKIVAIAMKAENEFKLTADELKEAISPKTKLLILPFPNNPTGATMNKEELEEIAKVLEDTDIIVLSDEIYSELTYDGKHVSFASIKGMKERTIVVNGFSKAFAMTGWRIGYVCAHKDLINAMVKIHQYVLMCAPSIAQLGALEGLKSSEDDVAAMVKEYDIRRKILLKGFNECGLTCFEPKGAFYLFPDISITGLTSEEFCDKLLDEEKVLMVPGVAFGESGEGFARATYASSVENLEEAIKRISKFVKKYR